LDVFGAEDFPYAAEGSGDAGWFGAEEGAQMSKLGGSVVVQLLLLAAVIVGALNVYVTLKKDSDTTKYFEAASGQMYREDVTGTYRKDPKGWILVPPAQVPAVAPGTQGDVDTRSYQPTRWFVDGDADGHGDWYRFVDAAVAPAGFVGNATDCDDGNKDVFEGATDSDQSPIDADCDGKAAPGGGPVEAAFAGDCGPEPGRRDCDGDGTISVHFAGTDCNDRNDDMYPGNIEKRLDGLDNDCDADTQDRGYMRPYDPTRFVAVHTDPNKDPKFKG
jgi:hypothetical protein